MCAPPRIISLVPSTACNVTAAGLDSASLVCFADTEDEEDLLPPGPIDPERCLTMGHGLIGGTAGKSETITIQVRLLAPGLSGNEDGRAGAATKPASGQVRDHVHCILPHSSLQQGCLAAASTFRPMHWQCTCLSQC